MSSPIPPLPHGGQPAHVGVAPGTSAPLSRLLELTADAVQGVRGGKSLTDLLARVPADVRPGVQALSFHTLRWLGSASEARAHLAAKAPPANVDALLVTALALLWPGEPLPYAEHTLVDQAVSAARQRVPAAAAFINAVLRRFLRERDAVVAAVRHAPLGAYNHPLWWIERVRHDWPQDWQALLLTANQRPPMTLRVNARRGTGDNYRLRLAALGRRSVLLDSASTGIPGPSQTLVVDPPLPVQQLLGFAEGELSVQDAAAQRAAPLLLQGLRTGARVLDACAAPGGKTAHLLELADLDLLALDSDPVRLARIQDGLHRLQLPAQASTPPWMPSGLTPLESSTPKPPRPPPAKVEIKVGDARHPASWWDGRPFDAILLDAPCTASGIVRRHPDVRWLRRADDITALARIQAQLLDALWPLLAPGGRLLYVTCSLFKAEGAHQIDAFLQRLPPGSARLDPASPGHLLSSRDNPQQATAATPPVRHDSFFYALLHKTQVLAG
jgi:16S rRNA (cytosine967-C5)-methyltransferase